MPLAAPHAFAPVTGTLRARVLAQGKGWRVNDLVCTAGPGERAFEERHDRFCIAMVTGGTFRYRSERGSAVMAPGALVLGNSSEAFECGHDHSAGDRCLAFHYDPDYFERIVAGVSGARACAFTAARLPPNKAFIRLLAEASAGADGASGIAYETLALELAGQTLTALSESGDDPAPTARDEKRIGDVLRYLETAGESASIAELASIACMSPYHFVRTFRRVVGLSPHQHILQTRLVRAAARIRASGGAVSALAFDSSFNDLSTFNRMFRVAFGMSPSKFREGRTAEVMAA